MAVKIPTPPRRSRRRLLWLLAGLVVVGAWAVATLFTLQAARRDTQAGIDKLELARGVLTPKGLIEGVGVDLLRDAEADFARARDRVRSPLVAPLRIMPVLGRQVRSVDSLTGSAADVVDVGIDAIDQARAELEGSRPDGAERVALSRRLGDIAGESAKRLRTIELGPGEALVGPLRNARERFDEELGQLRDAADRMRDASYGFADFLDGPSRYLVLAANNNEMRAGSGTFLSVGVLTVADGKFDLGEMTPTRDYELPEGAVEISGDLAARWGWLEPEREWRNLGSSPRFDTQAELAVRMWKAATGDDVDGVLALDPLALQALLEATGAVVVEGVEYDAHNVLDEIYVRQYEGIVGYPEQQDRRDQLSAIARAAIENLEEGGWDTVDLVDALRRAAEGRHVLAWSSAKSQDRGWQSAGVAGVLHEDSLLLGVHNRGGNKLDRYLEVRARLTSSSEADGETEVRVVVELRNRAPEGLPQYVAGPFPNAQGGAEGLYQGLLVAELPELARDLSITDETGAVQPLRTAGSDGDAWVMATYTEVARGESRAFVVRFRLPVGATSLRVEPSARYPAVTWSFSGEEWTDEQARTVEW